MERRTHALSALLHPPSPREYEEASSIDLPVENPPAKKKTKCLASNSLRCKLYRDQKQQYEDSLVTKIALLKQETATLERGLWHEKTLMLRHVSLGSIDKITREFFALFEYGLPSRAPLPMNEGLSISQIQRIQQANDRVRSQEAFLHHMMDSQVAIGPLKGIQSLIMMTRKATTAFANVRKVLLSLEVIGSEESPVVVARAVTYSIITRESFQIYFPGVALDNELIHKYLHTPLAIDNTMTFQFTSEGRVEAISMESSFIVGMIKSGWSMADASRALPHIGVPKALEDHVASKLRQRSLSHTSNKPSASLVPSYPSRHLLLALVQECCTLFEIGMEEAPPSFIATVDIKAKKAFLHRVLDTNVAFEDVDGVEAVVRLWLYVADAMANVRKQITNVSIVGDEDAPILIIQMKNEISSELLSTMISQANPLKQDTTLYCFSNARFHFTQDTRVSFCSFDSGCSDALQAAGMGLEETSRVLQWISSIHKSAVASSGTSQGRLAADTQLAIATDFSRGIPQDTSSKRAPKSNRERGQAFRLRRKRHHVELQGSIDQLRTTVSQLKARVSQLEQGGME